MFYSALQMNSENTKNLALTWERCQLILPLPKLYYTKLYQVASSASAGWLSTRPTWTRGRWSLVWKKSHARALLRLKNVFSDLITKNFKQRKKTSFVLFVFSASLIKANQLPISLSNSFVKYFLPCIFQEGTGLLTLPSQEGIAGNH